MCDKSASRYRRITVRCMAPSNAAIFESWAVTDSRTDESQTKRKARNRLLSRQIPLCDFGQDGQETTGHPLVKTMQLGESIKDTPVLEHGVQLEEEGCLRLVIDVG